MRKNKKNTNKTETPINEVTEVLSTENVDKTDILEAKVEESLNVDKMIDNDKLGEELIISDSDSRKTHEDIETVEMSAIEIQKELQAPTDGDLTEVIAGTGEEVYVGEETQAILPPDLDIVPEPYASVYDNPNELNAKTFDEVVQKPITEPVILEFDEPPLEKKQKILPAEATTKKQKAATIFLTSLMLFMGGFFYIQHLSISDYHASAVKYQKDAEKQGNLREDVSALESTLEQEKAKKAKLAEIVTARTEKFDPALANAVSTLNSAKSELDIEADLNRVREIQDDVTQIDKITVKKIETYATELTKIHTTVKAKLDAKLKEKKEAYEKAQQQNSEIAAQLEKEIADSKAKLEKEQAEQAERDRIAAEEAEKKRIEKEKADKEKAEQEAKDKAEEEAKKKAEEEAKNKP